MWHVKFLEEAVDDVRSLDNSLKKQIFKGIAKVSINPLPHPNGYGKPLGNKGGNNLTNFFKIKYRGIGIRVVYTLAPDSHTMNIIVISQRDDDYCYSMAEKLYQKYGNDIFKDIFNELG